LCVTGAMIGDQPRSVSLAMKLMSFGVRKAGQSEVMDDRDEQERLVRASALSYTVIKPPRLTDAESKTYNASATLSVGVSSHLSRTALARFLVDEAMQPKYAHSAVYLQDL